MVGTRQPYNLQSVTVQTPPNPYGRSPALAHSLNGSRGSPPSVIITEAEATVRLRRAQRQRRWWWCQGRRSPSVGLVLLGYVLVVAMAVTGERVAFKMSIDKMEPFRVFLAIVLVASLALCSWLVVVYKRYFTHEITRAMDRFPRRDILTIALLDSLHLYTMVISGAPTPPVLTVLLMQGTLPVMMALSKACPRASRRHYVMQHWVGAAFITAGVVLPLAATAFETRMGEMGVNAVVYSCACLPSAMSQLVKEAAIVRFGQPMDVHYLNGLLGAYQFAILLLLCPLAFRFQGLGRGWSAYAKTDLGGAMYDLAQCLLLRRPIEANKYPVEPICDREALPAVMTYLGCTALLTFAVNGLLRRGSVRVLYRTLNLSVALAFLALAVYSMDQAGWVSPVLNVVDVLGLAVLLLGLEVYHQQQEPDTELLTQWSPVATSGG